ncbi:PTS system cellobiose-specific IIC component [Enterococcus sp. UD-01]|jgi:PTS system cellobiose-specific IIC component
MKMNISTFENRLAVIGDKISQQRFLSTIKDAFMISLPLTFIGSISLLLSNPPIMDDAAPFLLRIREFLVSLSFLNLPYQFTTGIYGLWIALLAAYFHAKKFELNTVTSMFISGVSFLSISAVPKEGSIPMDGIGSKGIFSAMIVGIACVELYKFLLDKNIRIKMPDTVPPMVGASFDSIIAFFIALFMVISINQLLLFAVGMNLTNSIFAIFRPLVSSSDTLAAVIISVLITRLLWFFGIHGGAVTGAVMTPFLLSNLVENQAAYAAGKALPHVLTQTVFQGSFWGQSFLPAAIVMIFFCKSDHLKAIGKLGSIPAFCGIGEPINFGTPYILNFSLMIPGLLQPVLNSSIAFLCMKYGLINRVVVDPPLGTPGPIAVFIASMDWRAVVLWVLLLIVNCLILLPFMKAYDKQLLMEESGEAI